MTTKPDLSHIAEPIRKLAVPISALVEDDKNARVHGGRNLDAIAASLGRFGQVKPIVVQVREDGSRVVRAGNGTLEAARSRLGWTHLAVIETRMTDEEAIAYGIADNQTGALASWDLEVLAEHFSLLADIPDLVGATGFLDAEIAPLLHADFGAVEADISATPSGQSIEVVSARWGSLRKRFLVPPFSVVDTRRPEWRKRAAAWEVVVTPIVPDASAEAGRKSKQHHVFDVPKIELRLRKQLQREPTWEELNAAVREITGRDPEAAPGGFDPALAELLLLWFSARGGAVLDPFAGGPERGAVAALLGRRYVGVDASAERVALNRRHTEGLFEFVRGDVDQPFGDGLVEPRWIAGDASGLDGLLGDRPEFDLIFTRLPRYDMRAASGPDDLSLNARDWDGYLDGLRAALRAAAGTLRANRFAVIVLSETRDKSRIGAYRGLASEVIRVMSGACDMPLYNELVVVGPTKSIPLRAGRQFDGSRKVAAHHETVLVFVKGDPKAAAAALGVVETPQGSEDTGDDVEDVE